MKNQGVVKFFAIALVLVCIFQLSFTWKAISIENDIEEEANGDPVLARKLLDSIAASNEGVYNLGFKNFTYLQVKERQLNLGLDLQGGMNVVLEISVSDIIRALANDTKNVQFNRALDSAIAVKSVKPETDIINEFSRQFRAIAPTTKLSSIFATQENKQSINFTSSDDEVLAFIRKEADESVSRSFKILQTRIDQFGVTQPTIQVLPNSGRVMVELPGVDNPDRVRKLLQNTAELQFWNVYSVAEFYSGYYDKINEYLEQKEKTSTPDSATIKAEKDSVARLDSIIKQDSVRIGNDSLFKVYKDSIALAKVRADSIKKQNRRDYLKETGFELSIATDPNDENKQMLATTGYIGRVALKDTARINSLLNNPELKDEAIIPPDMFFAWDFKADEGGGVKSLGLYALKTETDGSPVLSGDVITNAYPNVDQSGRWEISMAMNLEGSKKWEKITEAAAAANNRAVAIVLDGKVYSAPSVNEKISGGSSRIMGSFSQDEAKDLANILKAGKMPARARIVQEAIVGPSLGQQAISSGLLSMILGFLATILIVYLFYNMAGLIADIAVLLNLFFIVGTLASFGAALTLPGIAGIILTLAMAVDANVLIYERVKDELDAGRNLRNAISIGFKNAAAAIIDGNLTTLLAGFVLAIFGTGPIYGFAITLIIGLISSLFTAFLLTRVMFEWLMKREKKVSFWFSFSKGLLRNANYNFIGNRKWFYICSSIVVIAGTVSMATRGFDLGVDFEGGWSYVVKFDKPVSAPELREGLTQVFEGAPEVKLYGSDEKLKITTSYMTNSQAENAGDVVAGKLDEGLKKLGITTYEVESADRVSATVAEDIKRDSLISIVVALIGMFIYILARFGRWQFAASTVVKLIHDTWVMLSLYSLLNGVVPFTLELDQGFIAAILTIIGYSINDSVVVFDRVREYLREHKKHGDTKTVINMALNSTLSRTIITGVTTIVVVLILFIFGGETIRGFSFCLTIGVIVGTYSSLCIGSPLAVDMTKDLEEAPKQPQMA